MTIIHPILEGAVERGASDIHLIAGVEPIIRVSGKLTDTDFEALDDEHMNEIVDDIIPKHLADRYRIEHEADFSIHEDGLGRFRVNVFFTQGSPAVVLRHVKTEILTVDQLHLPDSIRGLAYERRGIVLVCGTTGSGKSTTLAAIIQEMNTNLRNRIITIEDPIEYEFRDDRSVISQREVGLDTLNFLSALKSVLRQDPDVIMIGEMRDNASFMAALTAAETGHLVLSTLHVGTADQAVSRIQDFFPAAEREQIRMSLAENLRAVICQRLCQTVAGGVVPAVEIMINTSTVSNLIEKNKLDVLAAAIESGGEDGMQTFNQSIYQWITNGTITEAEGMLHSTNHEALRMNLKGIFLTEGSGILAT